MILQKSNVQYIDHMGTDKSVVNAARVSFSADNNNMFNKKDEKLIYYLAKHNHWSPFAHTSIQLKITAPIFIARQLVKHQVGGVWNEISRRYVNSEVKYFENNEWRGKPVNAKQGSSGLIENQEIFDKSLIELYKECDKVYKKMIDSGICPEQARMVLPLGSMTEWYWTGSLIFWARVCKQRLDEHAQKEASDVANLIDYHCKSLFPVSWGALMDQTIANQ